MRLQGKRALITGGGRGIGRAYVERFLREGARVVIGDIDRENAQATVEEFASLGEVSFRYLDVTDPHSVSDGVAGTVRTLGGLDVLVNNAALLAEWDRHDESYENLQRVFEVNLHSLWLMTRAAAPHLIASGAGRVINQASTAAYSYGYRARDDFPGLSSFSYAQSKRGVVGLTKFCAGQLGNWNVTVNAIAPGVVRTAALDGLPDEQLAQIEAMQAVKGAIQPEDLTGIVVYFASDEARFTTGQVVVVDGGRVMPA